MSQTPKESSKRLSHCQCIREKQTARFNSIVLTLGLSAWTLSYPAPFPATPPWKGSCWTKVAKMTCLNENRREEPHPKARFIQFQVLPHQSRGSAPVLTRSGRSSCASGASRTWGSCPRSRTPCVNTAPTHHSSCRHPAYTSTSPPTSRRFLQRRGITFFVKKGVLQVFFTSPRFSTGIVEAENLWIQLVCSGSKYGHVLLFFIPEKRLQR